MDEATLYLVILAQVIVDWTSMGHLTQEDPSCWLG